MLSDLRNNSKSKVSCIGSEVNFKSSEAVIEGLNSKGLGSLHSTEEWVKVRFKHPSTECRRNGGQGTVQLVCSIHAYGWRSSAIISKKTQSETGSMRHLSQNRSSDVRIWNARWTMSPRFTLITASENSVVCVIAVLISHSCGIAKLIRRYCRSETSTRYVPANTGSFLKSRQSIVGALQEQPINCKQASGIHKRCNNNFFSRPWLGLGHHGITNAASRSWTFWVSHFWSLPPKCHLLAKKLAVGEVCNYKRDID